MKRLPAKTYYYLILGVVMLIIALSVTTTHAQQVMPIGNPTALNLSKGGFHADSSFQLPFRPSRFANFDSTGRMYYNRYGDSGVYYHNGILWIKLLSSAAAGVTSITAAGYMLGGTVTTTGTFTPDTAAGKLATKTDLLGYFPKVDSNTHGNAITYDYYYANLPLDADSLVFATNYDVDTAKTNIRAQIAGLGVDSTVYQTNYRTDTLRQNVYNYIATKGSGTVTTVTVTAINGVSGTVANPTTTPAISISVDTIQSGTEMAGTIHAIAIPDPSTPATNTGFIYMDNTHHVLNIKNDAGVVSNTAIPNAGAANSFFKSFSADGTFTLELLTKDTTISANYTLTSLDHRRHIHCTNGSNINVTIPTGLAVTFYCDVFQEGAGNVVFVASSTTLNFVPNGTTKTLKLGAGVYIGSFATADNFTVQGALQP